MDIKNRPEQKSHIHILTKAFFQKPILSFLTYPVSFIFAFLLSRANLLGSASPFGLAVSAAIGTSRYSLFGLLGATLGYLSVLEQINSLKYIACIILIFTAHFVFSGTSVYRKRYFIPFSVILPSTCINLVFLASGNFSVFECALTVFEISAAGICAVFLSHLMNPELRNSSEFTKGILTLSLGTVISLCNFPFTQLLSPGKTLALVIVLLSSFCGGTVAGATCGILFGCAVSLAVAVPEYGLLYGVCGICVSLFSRFGKIPCALSAIAVGTCICACLDISLLLPFAAEITLASVLFLLTEKRLSGHMRRFFLKSNSRSDIHLRLYAAERLGNAAQAFRNLGNALGDLHKKDESTSLSEISSLFEKNTKKLCKKCSLSPICWERDFQSTRDSFMKASTAIEKNGLLCARDLPIYFSSRCPNIENIINSVNREIFAFRYRAQIDEKLRESRELLTRQYSDAATVFSSLSSDISDNARFDESAEAEIHDFLTRRGILCDTAVYRDSENHINIHLCGRDLSCIEKNYPEFEPVFSSACKTSLTKPKYSPSPQLDDIVIRELPKLRASFGVSVKSRSGLDRSGDSGTLFYPATGKLAVLLSDGMGSGSLAARESAGNVKLLSELLRSGLSPKTALSTLQSALIVRSEFTGTFATLDLFYADMFSGHAEVYKLGGAPTYIKRDEKIRRITASSLPAGISIGTATEPDVTSLILSPGDYVIMTSDGIADGTDDVKLLEFLSSQNPSSPKSLSDELLAFSATTYGKSDDMTVAVILIESEY